LLHLIGGILSADEGTLEVAGEQLTGMKETTRDAFRAARIGYVFQDFHLIPSLTALQNVELALSPPLAHKGVRETRRERRERTCEWFARVGLAERMEHLPVQLSRGEQQRVAIIRALVNRPPLILADEPTGSLDRETGQAVMRLLVELSREAGATLIAVTHDRELARLFPASAEMREINALMWDKEQDGGRCKLQAEVEEVEAG
jgi:putative ABC transport system ATP-binding protein